MKNLHLANSIMEIDKSSSINQVGVRPSSEPDSGSSSAVKTVGGLGGIAAACTFAVMAIRRSMRSKNSSKKEMELLRKTLSDEEDKVEKHIEKLKLEREFLLHINSRILSDSEFEKYKLERKEKERRLNISLEEYKIKLEEDKEEIEKRVQKNKRITKESLDKNIETLKESIKLCNQVYAAVEEELLETKKNASDILGEAGKYPRDIGQRRYSRNLKMKNSENPEIENSENPETGDYENLEMKKSENPETENSNLTNGKTILDDFDALIEGINTMTKELDPLIEDMERKK